MDKKEKDLELELFTLTALTKYLNENYKNKKTGEPFTVSDVQSYCRRGKLPDYLGEIYIFKEDKIKPGVNLYYLVK